MLLYIIRHGDPNYKTDSLTPRGQLQAEAVAKRLVASGIDRIFTSPMGRARQTAEPTCRALGLDYTVEDWTHEIEDERLTPYPDGKLKSISVLPNTVFRENGNVDLSYEDSFTCTGINQTQMDKAVRFIEQHGDDFLERLGYKKENGVYRILQPNEERVALFCHAAFSRAWLSTLLHVPLHLMWGSFIYTHTGVTVLHFKNYESGFTAPRCLSFCDMSHLFAAGLDMKFDNGIEI
ncbi:MAG: histidine phosphatase family protein [Clostridia bacterium]|nr:histidine phosphatase family protein [Clostridia bacterium]